MDFFRGVDYFCSFPDVDQCPVGDLPVIAVTGRSNSGKSTLISALCNHKKLAHTSRKAGKTRLLNYFRVPEGGEDRFFLVDMPGYGFARMPDAEKKKLRTMVDRYLLECQDLAGVLLILDARRVPGTEEHGILSYCHERNIPCLFIRSKWDTMNNSEKGLARRDWKKLGVDSLSLPVSASKGHGIEDTLKWIRQKTMED